MSRMYAFAAPLALIAAPLSAKPVYLSCHFPAHDQTAAEDLSVTFDEQTGSMSFVYPDGSGRKLDARFTADEIVATDISPVAMAGIDLGTEWRINRSRGDITRTMTATIRGLPTTPKVSEGTCTTAKAQPHKF